MELSRRHCVPFANQMSETTRPQRKADTSTILIGGVIVAMIVAVAWSWFSQGIVATIFSTQISSAEKLSRVKQYFLEFGPFAPVVYVLFVTVEVVVAPLPGLMLYAPGGIVFGGFWGGLLSLIGNVLGAGIACFAARRLSERLLTKFAEGGSLNQIAKKLDQRGVLVIALLRINPLTSSDLVSYAAGLVSMPVSKVMVGTTIGMAPLCWAQSYLADNILTAFPQLLYPLVVGCVIYAAAVIWVARKMLRSR